MRRFLVPGAVVLLMVFSLGAGTQVTQMRSGSTVVITFGGMSGFQYVPSSVKVSVGDTVLWSGDLSFHPLVSDDGLWHTPFTGTTFSYTFVSAGTYRFHCLNHGGPGGFGMSGVVEVGFRIYLPIARRQGLR